MLTLKATPVNFKPMSKPRRKQTTGDLIRYHRLRKGLTQQDLAKKCKWRSKTMIAHYEAGRTVPLVRNMILIAKKLECKFQDLLPE